jgi:hypothetical protein
MDYLSTGDGDRQPTIDIDANTDASWHSNSDAHAFTNSDSDSNSDGNSRDLLAQCGRYDRHLHHHGGNELFDNDGIFRKSGLGRVEQKWVLLLGNSTTWLAIL